MKRIDSTANPAYKSLLRLVESSRERKKSGRSVLDGVHLVAAYRQYVGLPERVAVSRGSLESREIASLLSEMPATEVIVLSDALFKSLSTVVSPTGIIAVVETPRAMSLPRSLTTCLMLEDLQDPGNLGSILRTCAAAGVKDVLLSGASVHAWSPRVLRAAMGAHFALSIHEGVDLPAAAHGFKGTRVAMLPRAQRTLYDVDLAGNTAFLLGNEGAGLSAQLLAAADAVVSIPMPGKAESLNVAAAAAVCLFERVRQLSGIGG